MLFLYCCLEVSEHVKYNVPWTQPGRLTACTSRRWAVGSDTAQSYQNSTKEGGRRNSWELSGSELTHLLKTAGHVYKLQDPMSRRAESDAYIREQQLCRVQGVTHTSEC